MKSHTILILVVVVLACGSIGILVFPELAMRWKNYNMTMIAKIARNIYPFFFINLGVAATVFTIEAIVVGWEKSSFHRLLRPDKSMRNDICIFLASMLQLDYALIFLITLGITHKLELKLKTAIDLDHGLLASTIQSPTHQLIIYVLIVDFTFYFVHYLHHKSSFLWPFHSFHHSATELNVLTANRGHPVQSELTNTLIAIIPLTLIGVPLVSLLVFRIFRNTLIFMHHSRLPWKWGWFGKYILVSPGYHRVHHSVLPEHYDKNLSVLFPVWDHLFGTYYKGNIPAIETGLPDNPYNKKSFVHDMLVPFRMLRRKEKKGGMVEGQNGGRAERRNGSTTFAKASASAE